MENLIYYIKDNYWLGYQKTNLNHFEIRKDKLEKALANAEWLMHQIKEDYNNSNGIHELNPYVTVDELVKFLLNH